MKTWLFDFDGTLVDSMPTYASVMLRILEENQIPCPDGLMKIITPLGYQGTAAYYRKMGLQMEQEAVIARMTQLAQIEYANNIPAKPNVARVLRELRERGDDLHVLTASPHSMLDPCLKRLGLWELFTNVWSCDDFATTKADPQIYMRAARHIGRPVQEIWFLDDNFHADRTAKEAGMRVCGVYDDSSREYEVEIRAVTDCYIYDFAELPAIE